LTGGHLIKFFDPKRVLIGFVRHNLITVVHSSRRAELWASV